MRILGIKISFKKESRWVPREEFIGLSEAVQNLEQDLRSTFNAGEALRKRVERHITKSNGQDTETPEPRAAQVRQPVRLTPGMVLSPDQIRELEG